MRDGDPAERGGEVMTRLLTAASSLLLIMLAMGAFILGSISYITGKSIELALADKVYQVAIGQGSLTLSNAPQLRLEDDLISQRQHAFARAYQRQFDSNDQLEKSTVWGTPYYRGPAERGKLIHEQRDADGYVSALRRMRWPPTSRSVAFSFSCRGGAALALGAVSWLAWMLPPILFRRFRAAHPSRTGLCANCGYDLRASKDRCPECGMPIASEAKAIA
jgi:hypothetical protein